MNYEEMDLTELVNEWQDENNAHHFEGTSGVERFRKLCEAIGYKEGNYLGYGHAIENFLSDNPGALEALVNWIQDQDVDEWKESIIQELPEQEEEKEELEEKE